jgi:hypothetical protein
MRKGERGGWGCNRVPGTRAGGRQHDVALVPGTAATAILAYATYRHTRRERQERRVGYTTTYESHYRDYWQLDPRTGEVLRRPGELKARRRSE